MLAQAPKLSVARRSDAPGTYSQVMTFSESDLTCLIECVNSLCFFVSILLGVVLLATGNLFEKLSRKKVRSHYRDISDYVTLGFGIQR